jgi:hypothetical protein
MKKVPFLLSIVLFFALTTGAWAQVNLSKALKNTNASEIASSDNETVQQLLKALDPGKSFTSPDKYVKLLSGNKDMVSKGMDILNGKGTDSEKTSKLNLLKTEHLGFLENLLGKGKAGDYLKLIKPKIEPLAQKFALAKLFM